MSEVQRIISEMVAIHNEAQRLCAAGPWVKIEPSCEMPEAGAALLLTNGMRAAKGWLDDDGDWGGYGVCWEPTHYAVLRMPEE